MQLMELQPGKKAIIRRLEGGRTVLSRLAALGFTPGADITMLRSSDHGPLLVSLRGSRVALGRGEAAHIFVASNGEEKPAEIETVQANNFSIALAGQPNVGKSSVFNLLTGLNQHVGNWTGKTIECKTGIFNFKGAAFSVVDLPGTYSLTASSEEERLARDYIILAKNPGKQRRHVFQYLVALLVSQVVIHFFKFIHIRHDQADGVLAALAQTFHLRFIKQAVI